MTRRIILVDIGAGLTLRGVLPSVALFAVYSATLKASGGQAPYIYTVTAGAAELAAAGLYLDAATGIISGTAGTAGTLAFTVRVTDLSGAYIDRPYSITVIAEPLSLSGAAPAWTVGTPYSYTYTAEHGVPPYTWSLAAGALPAGLALNAATGTISGTPTAAGAPAWTIRVTDSDGAQLDLRDNATLQLLGDFADTIVGAAYTSDIAIRGGDLPYSNPRVTVGALPAGLALSIVGGALRLSGTPTASATSNFTAAMDSADGQTATSAQSVVADGDVISVMKFDGTNGSTVFNDGVSANIWAPHGSIAISNIYGDPWGAGVAALFDSDAKFLSLQNNATWNIGNRDLTVEAYIYAAAALPSFAAIIGKHVTAPGSANAISFLLGCNAGKLSASLYTNPTAWTAADASAFPLNTWRHVALVRHGGTLLLFLHGVLVASTSGLGTLALGYGAIDITYGHIVKTNAVIEPGLRWPGAIKQGVVTTRAKYTANFTPPARL